MSKGPKHRRGIVKKTTVSTEQIRFVAEEDEDDDDTDSEGNFRMRPQEMHDPRVVFPFKPTRRLVVAGHRSSSKPSRLYMYVTSFPMDVNLND